MPTLQALRLESGALALLQARVVALLQPLGRLVLVNEAKWGAVDVLGQLLWCVVVITYVAEASAAGAIALGGVFMVYEYARRAESSIGVLAADFSMLAGQLAGWRALQPLMAETATVPALPAPAPSWHRLSLKGVSLRFSEASAPVLRNVDLVLERGRSYALLGDSGAGKSALLALLAGLEPPCGGTLALDGRPMPASQLRAEATLVNAAAGVFEGTVRENVAPGSGIDDATLAARLAAVGLVEHVAGWPGGADGVVGEGTARWSQGQQQRLALARGLHAAEGTRLLLLDEPTSHLDPRSADETLQRLLALHPQACIVVAVHDLSLTRHFDACLRVSDGEVQVAAMANRQAA
jgi:ABC-type multidrug transport system fused ATPase/permease subunit